MTIVWQYAEVEIVDAGRGWYQLLHKGAVVKGGTFAFVAKYFWDEFSDI